LISALAQFALPVSGESAFVSPFQHIFHFDWFWGQAYPSGVLEVSFASRVDSYDNNVQQIIFITTQAWPFLRLVLDFSGLLARVLD
jgi:hypothetical protein